METHAIPIIGLTGLAGSGKDSVRALLEQHGYTGLAFADPIRDMLRTLFTATGTSTEYMLDRALKEERIPNIGTSYRVLAQTLGTEWGRSIDPNFWLRITGATIDASLQDSFGPVQIVISDVRFPNEADFIRQRGGQIWHVVRPGTQPVRAHESEAHALTIPADYTILNNGTLADLQGTVLRALEWADGMDAQAGQDNPVDPLFCTCPGEGLAVSELETGRCQTCGKAVIL